MDIAKPRISGRLFMISAALLSAHSAFSSEADVKIPNLSSVQFQVLGSNVGGLTLLYAGLVICVLGMVFGWIQYQQTNALEVH